MAYSAQTFVAGEQPTAAKWNLLWSNDASFNDGSGIAAGAIGTSQIADGAVTPAELKTGTGSSWAWQSYTPSVTNVTLGTGGTSVGSYIQIGQTVFFEGVITLGTGGSIGTQPTISLPVTAVATITYRPIGECMFEDVGTDVYVGVMLQVSTTTGEMRALQNGNSSDVSVHPKALTSTNPFSFGNTDRLVWKGFYQAA